MNCLQSLISRIKYYHKCKSMKLWNNRIPSSTYFKYPLHHQFEGKKVLNFGCGTCIYPIKNVVNIDCVPGEYVTVQDPSEIRLPFSDNTFDLIIANHVMEHIPNWFETMKEFARIVKVGGQIEIWIPPISSDTSFGYRDHINRIGVDSFAGCKTIKRPGSNLLAAKEFKELGEFRKLEITNFTARPIVTWWTTFAPDSLLHWMTMHLRNVISEEGFFFTKGE